MTKQDLPKEYTITNGDSGSSWRANEWAEYKGAEIVKARIEAALKKVEMPDTVRDNVQFNVRMVKGAFDMKTSNYRKFTRVYIGSSWNWGHKTEKEMMVSKMNQSIDLEKVVSAIVARAKASRNAELSYDKKRENENESETVAEGITKEFDLSYSSRVRVNGGSNKNSVRVELNGAFSPADARRIVAFIKAI
jgi:hypothetical protein